METSSPRPRTKATREPSGLVRIPDLGCPSLVITVVGNFELRHQYAAGSARVARTISVRPPVSETNSSASPEGVNVTVRSSSGVLVTCMGSRNSVSITQTSPPAINATSRPSLEKATCVAVVSTRRSLASRVTSEALTSSNRLGGCPLAGLKAYRSKRCLNTIVEPSAEMAG